MGERKFIGRVGRTMAETELKFETVKKYPDGAPNVVYIVLDDLGFSGLGCYGSTIDTPNIDRLAQNGLRYNNFHTTAICSATRASLLTGANHHAAGVASVIDFKTGCENSLGHVKETYATAAEILHEYDYGTYAAGKWHLSDTQTPSGPYDNWPLGRGFDRFYGFLQGATDQFNPQLIRDNTFVTQPKKASEGYHLSEDITDNAIDLIFNHINADGDRPFFLYLAYGAMHEPHHAPQSYIDKYKGKFDKGWDKIREEWFENQKRLGVIPENAELTVRAPIVDPWDSLSDDKKKVYAKYMEVFAGFLEHTDAQIGRVIDYLESVDKLDNTVIVLLSDNGASAEGGKAGRLNSHSSMDATGEDDDVEYALKHYDEMGSEFTHEHYPTGWANALNTPFQWYKSFAHEGGVKDPLIISYPKLVKDGGSVRNQYAHVIDITPTILDIIGVEKPDTIKGIPQEKMHGISLKYTLESPDEASRRRIQYYEMVSNKGIYKDGWKAVINHTFNESYAEDKWELYHVSEDYSEKYNVADKYPEKLQELTEQFYIEAGKYDVFPVTSGGYLASKDNLLKMLNSAKRPGGKLSFKNIFKPYILTAAQGALLNNYTLTAQLTRKSDKDEGVIISSGGRFGGFSFYIKDNKLKFAYKNNRDDLYIITSDAELPSGSFSAGYTFIVKDRIPYVKIFAGGAEVAGGRIDKPYFIEGDGETTLKANVMTAVSDEYEVPFEFSVNIDRLDITSFGTEINAETELLKSFHLE